MDNCETYYHGKIENWFGRAFRPGRAKVFLMTTLRRHGPSAQVGLRMLEERLVEAATFSFHLPRGPSWRTP
jgi:hypothetical protein